MKRNLLFIIALFACALSFGQGEIDAYRYSSNDLSGTARGQAMGGAFGALGGDVTGVAINPAGIGIYRSSEVVANMSLASPLTGGNTHQQSNTKFGFDNLSYIAYYPLVSGSMLSLNFGFNYNRTKSFNQTYNASRPEMQTSLTDYMALVTNGTNHTMWDGRPTKELFNNTNIPWLGILAFDGFLINETLGTSDGYESILNHGERVKPALKVTESGRVENYDFTVGSNIANKFYWGTTVTITDLSYLMKSSYKEDFLGEGGGFELTNYLETKGSGFQVKAGMIFRPTEVLRIGLSYHSPVWYSMTDYYSALLIPNGIPNDKGGFAGETETPPNKFYNYQLRTPGTWTLSLAAVLGTQAVVSLDYENKNYAAMNLKDDRGYDSDFKDANSFIGEDYKRTSTIRAGLEYRFTPQFSGRLGYAFAQNPYSDNLQEIGKTIVTAGTVPHFTLSGDVNYLTAGFGFRFTPQFYADFALVYRSQKDNFYYFPPVDVDGVVADSFHKDITNQSLKGLVTLGYRF